MPDRLDALKDRHGYIPSVDVCAHCNDSECDGIGCIAALDPSAEKDAEAISRLHDLLRAGWAWQVTQAVLDAGQSPRIAVFIAKAALDA